jgi:two-component system OmpR family response regulator
MAELKVLITEDTEAVLELLTTRLELAGYRTYQARNRYQALKIMAETPMDALILDLSMPHLDGFELLKKMQTNVTTRLPPTLVLTARKNPEDVKRAISLGARDYMVKPFDDRILLARVARLMQKRTAA